MLYFVRTDHIGRPVFATDTAGTVVWTSSYLPFGSIRVSSGLPIDLRFPGQWFQSESGLFQNWMRDYDPTTGRYLQADPLGLIDGASVYGYARQSPLYWIDPTGRFRECPASPPVNDPSWVRYPGNPSVFHCGFLGYLENRTPSVDDPANECFYDDKGCLVDDDHLYRLCRGTPNQYCDPIRHTVFDSGGIVANGWGAFHESQRYFSDREREQCSCEPTANFNWGY